MSFTMSRTLPNKNQSKLDCQTNVVPLFLHSGVIRSQQALTEVLSFPRQVLPANKALMAQSPVQWQIRHGWQFVKNLENY